MDRFTEETLKTAIRRLILSVTEDTEVVEHTPIRVVEAYKEMLKGYGEDPTEILKEFDIKGKGVNVYETCEFYSLCEHHLLPFYGKVHIAYITRGKAFGLSKLARLVDAFSRRLQIQERMTNQIADAIYTQLELNKSLEFGRYGVAVIVEGKHLCMAMRGIKKQEAITITKAYRGVFASSADYRHELLSVLREKKVKV